MHGALTQVLLCMLRIHCRDTVPNSVRLTGRDISFREANGFEICVEAIGLAPLVLTNGFVILNLRILFMFLLLDEI